MPVRTPRASPRAMCRPSSIFSWQPRTASARHRRRPAKSAFAHRNDGARCRSQAHGKLRPPPSTSRSSGRATIRVVVESPLLAHASRTARILGEDYQPEISRAAPPAQAGCSQRHSGKILAEAVLRARGWPEDTRPAASAARQIGPRPSREVRAASDPGSGVRSSGSTRSISIGPHERPPRTHAPCW